MTLTVLLRDGGSGKDICYFQTGSLRDRHEICLVVCETFVRHSARRWSWETGRHGLGDGIRELVSRDEPPWCG